MEQQNDKRECTVCGVPMYLHNTACGWSNSNLIIYPQNAEEIEWQRKQLEAKNSQLIIDKDGVFISSGGIVQSLNNEAERIKELEAINNDEDRAYDAAYRLKPSCH